MILVTSRYSSARRRLLAPDKVRPRVFVPPEGFGVLVSPFVYLVKPREELVEHCLFHAHGMIENVEVEQAPFFCQGDLRCPTNDCVDINDRVFGRAITHFLGHVALVAWGVDAVGISKFLTRKAHSLKISRPPGLRAL